MGVYIGEDGNRMETPIYYLGLRVSSSGREKVFAGIAAFMSSTLLCEAGRN